MIQETSTKKLLNAEEQMRLLFEIYYEQCQERKIKYTASELRDGLVTSWIVMDGIELAYTMHQGEQKPIFMCSRYCEEFGDDTYYFDNYQECLEVWLMPMHKLTKYVRNLGLKFNDVDGNELSIGDSVVAIDVDDLGESDIVRGDILKVSHLYDVESNYIGFNNGGLGFFGHRVLKINYNTL